MPRTFLPAHDQPLICPLPMDDTPTCAGAVDRYVVSRLFTHSFHGDHILGIGPNVTSGDAMERRRP